mgnify:CR=1 FL=1
MSTAASAVRADNRSLLVRLVVIAAAMFAFGYALVPFYEQICRVTGLRDIGRPDEVRNTQVDATRNVRIELDANTRGLPWRFKPLAASIDVHPGALNQVEYEIVNETDRPVAGARVVVKLLTNREKPRELFSGATAPDGRVEATVELPEVPDTVVAVLCVFALGLAACVRASPFLCHAEQRPEWVER